MMIDLGVALLEAVASVVRNIRLGPTLDNAECRSSLESLVNADDLLFRVEGIVEAAGHKAMCALVQADRGQLRSLAADLLVSRALLWIDGSAEAGLSESENSLLQELLEADEDAEDAEDERSELDGTPSETPVFRYVGRLGDQAMALAFAAQKGVDAVVEHEVVSVISLMASGALQAAAARFWAWPPAGLPAPDARRAAISMLTQSLDLLPPGNHFSAPCITALAPNMCAHAHLMQAEVQADIAAPDKPQHKQQRIVWHLDKACSALHSNTAEVVSACPSSLLLVHIHITRARLFLCSGVGAGGKKHAEQAVEELISGCRELRRACGLDGGSRAVDAPSPAWAEAGEALLKHLRSTLRELCAKGVSGDGAAGKDRWKVLYRATLQLTSSWHLVGIPELYDSYA
eukprot:CAMPEP_0177154646 /NCGR_PEP_ID=MMETSP0367-20130122/1744_1 /TAXON_ID=447022 ORGANISM="Scrippsiella hangoei-like, Strain SHHI-4" /NCGR_SAMPLE_ID=MMETSP0367 /ASSEMBLY_ACC=CAM_ASM_000362 /LENGTH=402 /DNA_ID=CAMNT_0018599927 /DNA_START=76 /DNA_END=1284 /DNA_ORIENTATION=-